MAEVNQAPLVLPKSWLQDRELRNFGKELTFVIFQLRERAGGGSDQTEKNTINIAINAQGITVNANNIQVNANNIASLENGFPEEEFFADDFQGSYAHSVQSNAYTTYRNEIIKLNADIPVTLNATPADGESCYIKSATGKGFNVLTSKGLDGYTDTRFGRPYYGLWCSYSADLDTWSIL